MKEAIKLLKKNNLLKIIDDELDIYLEIPHIAYVEVKSEDSKAILFTNVVDKKNGNQSHAKHIKSDIPERASPKVELAKIDCIHPMIQMSSQPRFSLFSIYSTHVPSVSIQTPLQVIPNSTNPLKLFLKIHPNG